MFCTYPNCDCRMVLPEGEYPRPGECPKGPECRADRSLTNLAAELFELFQSDPSVWQDRDRLVTLNWEFERMQRLMLIAQQQYAAKAKSDANSR